MGTTDYPSFGDMLRWRRQSVGLSQEDLALRAELSVREINYLERNRHTARPSTVQRLADALALSDEDRRSFLLAAGIVEPPSIVPPVPTTILPVSPTPFIGRMREVGVITELLRGEDIRLLTLTGMAGTGKTRLAIEVASQLLDAFTDEVVFVPLAGLTDPGLVAPTLAVALGVPQSSGRSVVVALKTSLQRKRILLILDNFEHLIPAAPLVGELLATCPGLKILATSREILHLSAEHRYNVPGLDVPGPGRLPGLDSLTQFDAISLFIARARAIDSEFTLTEPDAPAVVEICRRLDGLPLAIELAAVRSKIFPPKDLLARLDAGLADLTDGPSDVPRRHRTVRAAIDWSYSLLSSDEQSLLTRFAVFADGGSLEAIERVCTVHGDLEPVPLLSSLLDKSLLRRQDGDELRIRMLMTTRVYATERLIERGESEAIRTRHAEYFLGLAEAMEPELTGRRQRETLARVERELDNFRAALRWFLDQGERMKALRLATALEGFWSIRADFSEGQRWLEEGLKESDGVTPVVRATALWALGRMYQGHGEGEISRALTVLEQALHLFQRFGELRGQARTLIDLGVASMSLGQLEDAGSRWEESLRLWQRLGDRGKSAEPLLSLGILAWQQRKLDLARERLTDARTIFRDVGSPYSIAFTLFPLGYVALTEERPVEAEELFMESLALAQSLRAKQVIVYAQTGLGFAAWVQGRQMQAQDQWRESLSLAREIGDTISSLLLLGALGMAAVLHKQAERGACILSAEMAHRERLGIPPPYLGRIQRREAEDEARTVLGAWAYDKACRRGQAMGLEEAIDFALDERKENAAFACAVP